MASSPVPQKKKKASSDAIQLIADAFEGCWVEWPAGECWIWVDEGVEKGGPLPKKVTAVRARHRKPGMRATWVSKIVGNKADLEAAVKNAERNGADRVEVHVGTIEWAMMVEPTEGGPAT